MPIQKMTIETTADVANVLHAIREEIAAVSDRMARLEQRVDTIAPLRTCGGGRSSNEVARISLTGAENSIFLDDDSVAVAEGWGRGGHGAT